MKRLPKSKQASAMLGVGLLVLAACAPDSLTRGGGAAQPVPIERSPASNANEAGVQAAPAINSSTQAVTTSTVTPPLPAPANGVTPKPGNELEVTGTVEVMASDMWVVGGRTVAVTAATEIRTGLAVGTRAKLHVVEQADGSLWAREIEPADDGNANSNINDNSNDDNGNGNVNSNDNNGNDDNGNGNSNDDNGNDDNVNSNDNNANANDRDENNNDNGGHESDDDGNGNSNHDNKNNDGNSNGG